MTLIRDALAVVGAWFLLSVGALFGFVLARDLIRRRAARKRQARLIASIAMTPGLTPAQMETLRRYDKELSR